MVLEDEDFDDAGSTAAAAWTSGTITSGPAAFSAFLGKLGSGVTEMSKTIAIPRSSGPDQLVADTVSVHFALYQIDDWAPVDKFYVEINSVSIDLGEMDSSSTSTTLTGVESGITWERQTVQQGTDLGFETDLDKKHDVTVTVPATSYTTTESVILTFRVVTSEPIDAQSAGVDDLVITAFYDCSNAGPTAAPHTGVPTVSPGSPTGTPTTASPTTASPTTAGPTTAAPTTARPTTAGPTVTPGSPTGTPTTASPTSASPCLLYTSPSPRDGLLSRMPSSA